MEQLSTTGVARNIGVADLFRDRLKELYDWSTVKPTIDQVNLAHCCTIPEVRSRAHNKQRVPRVGGGEGNALPSPHAWYALFIMRSCEIHTLS
jgi:hypothetical protein